MSQQHARPHLQTHSRAAGHSAVAGAAYRLGLRLFDERTQRWHDYRKRALGEEIVRALTIAPPDSPSWATDPAELWNRVEAAEKRKDAQIARDFRIPIPFGLSDEEAGDLAEEMSWFIVKALHTPVSMGLHRDGELDALGELKPPEKQGYHAHLFFPTRRLEQIEGVDGTSDWGLGAKFVALANKNSSGAFVESLNARWAELSNKFTAANDLPADYTHLSYARQGLALEPQPKLGRGAVALERKGFFTQKGDALRNHILVASKVYEAAHSVVLEVQKEQAIADAIRERTNPAARAARLAAEAAVAATMPKSEPSAEAPPAPAEPIEKPPLTSPAGSLVARFHAAAPAPTSPEERERFARAMKIVRIVERVLAAFALLAERFRRHTEDRNRRMAAKLDVSFQLDSARAERAAVEEKLKNWEAAHRWRLATAKAFTAGGGGMPRVWRALTDQVESINRRVQSLKSAVRSHEAHLDRFANEEVAMKAQREENEQRLEAAVVAFASLSPDLTEPLLAASDEVERGLIKGVLPEAVLAPVPVIEVPEQEAARLRPASRRLGP